jgi:hypothetical protein
VDTKAADTAAQWILKRIVYDILMSAYFVVLSNLSSIPCIIYYQHRRKYLYSLQILFNSVFSFFHHLNWSGLYLIHENGLFDFLDGVYSYLSIYLFSIYLMLSNHYELRTELFLIQTILLTMVYSNLGAVIVLPVTAFLTLMITGVHFQKMNSVAFRNPYLHLGVGLAVLDLTCFFLAVNYEYNYLHAVHHLIAFNLPIVVDQYVSTLHTTTEPPSIQLESPVIIPVLRI